MPDRTADVTRIVQGGRTRGLSDDRIRALVARYDERARDVPPSAAPAAPDWSARLGLRQPTANPALGFMRGAGTAAVDAAQGAVGGTLSTLYQGGGLI